MKIDSKKQITTILTIFHECLCLDSKTKQNNCKDFYVESLFLLFYVLRPHICDVLHDLISFLEFKKREKHPWRSVNFSKVADWY